MLDIQYISNSSFPKLCKPNEGMIQQELIGATVLESKPEDVTEETVENGNASKCSITESDSKSEIEKMEVDEGMDLDNSDLAEIENIDNKKQSDANSQNDETNDNSEMKIVEEICEESKMVTPIAESAKFAEDSECVKPSEDAITTTEESKTVEAEEVLVVKKKTEITVKKTDDLSEVSKSTELDVSFFISYLTFLWVRLI